MNQNQLDSAVAEATGETVATIRSRGFSIADPRVVCLDPEPSAPAPVSTEETNVRLQRLAL